jgi:STE24 endopeptidase
MLLLTAGALSLALSPVARALSRRQEHRADRFALRMTGAPGAFISAMKRLGAQNLAEEQPSTLTRVLFHSHPPMAERLRRARESAR